MKNIEDIEFRLLTEEEVFGDSNGNGQLDIFKAYGTKCAADDFAILSGAYVNAKNHTAEGKELKDRSGWWWTKTAVNNKYVRTVDSYGGRDTVFCNYRDLGVRPAIKYSSIKDICSSEERGYNGVTEVKCFEGCLTSAVDADLQNILEQSYLSGKLVKTNKKVPRDKRAWDDYDSPYEEELIDTYLYNGESYGRVRANFDEEQYQLSNGITYTRGSYVWCRSEPKTLLVSKEKDIAIFKNAIVGGIPFDINQNKKYDMPFAQTFMASFLKEKLPMMLAPTTVENYLQEFVDNSNENTANTTNVYGLNYEQVSEEEIIKGAIESDIPVMLHGESGDGKSARVKQFDKDATIIYLGTASLDYLTGKSVYSEKDGRVINIAPPWYDKHVKKCEKAPDKIHILFFDEITNGTKSTQGAALNIVLDKEVNGIWKLPENCRIVAAGNETKDSTLATKLGQPLFNRFAHAYIETKAEDWLKWATSKKKESETIPFEKQEESTIHPAICAYIAYKGEEVLRKPYTGEKPNADPRKWEMASQMLYKTNKPHMLRSLIGTELTTDFIAFTSQSVITLDDVLNGNYTDAIENLDVSKKYATIVGLTSADINDYEKVKDFTDKLGREYSAVFDCIWASDNVERLEKVYEAKMASEQEGGHRK